MSDPIVFSRSDVEVNGEKNSFEKMSPLIIQLATQAANDLGEKPTITDAYRSKERYLRLKRQGFAVSRDYPGPHGTGTAFDVSFSSTSQMEKFINILIKLGCKRFGVMTPSAMHFDVYDPLHPYLIDYTNKNKAKYNPPYSLTKQYPTWKKNMALYPVFSLPTPFSESVMSAVSNLFPSKLFWANWLGFSKPAEVTSPDMLTMLDGLFKYFDFKQDPMLEKVLLDQMQDFTHTVVQQGGSVFSEINYDYFIVRPYLCSFIPAILSASSDPLFAMHCLSYIAQFHQEGASWKRATGTRVGLGSIDYKLINQKALAFNNHNLSGNLYDNKLIQRLFTNKEIYLNDSLPVNINASNYTPDYQIIPLITTILGNYNAVNSAFRYDYSHGKWTINDQRLASKYSYSIEGIFKDNPLYITSPILGFCKLMSLTWMGGVRLFQVQSLSSSSFKVNNYTSNSVLSNLLRIWILALGLHQRINSPYK